MDCGNHDNDPIGTFSCWHNLISMSKWDDKLKIYDTLVAMSPNFERKGKTVPYTSANGYMFSFINKEGELGIRLSKESGKAFKEKYDATEFRSHGAVMKDYVLIPNELLNDLETLSTYLEESFQHVMSLPPK